MRAPVFCASIHRMAKQNTRSRTAQSPEIKALEADIAFFEARLAFTRHGDDTLHRRAQQRAYQSLRDSLSEKLKDLQRKDARK